METFDYNEYINYPKITTFLTHSIKMGREFSKILLENFQNYILTCKDTKTSFEVYILNPNPFTNHVKILVKFLEFKEILKIPYLVISFKIFAAKHTTILDFKNLTFDLKWDPNEVIVITDFNQILQDINFDEIIKYLKEKL